MGEEMALAQILWDYLCLNQQPKKADVIIGFGCYNEDIPRRAAQLYQEGYAPWILFTGGLGRNTSTMWLESEADRFARIAISEGVPERAILRENKSTNSGENLIFSRQLLEQKGISVSSVLGVHKPYMERRVAAAFPVYWPGPLFAVTSWQQSMMQYMETTRSWGRTDRETICMLAGDFQRIPIYAQRGYQLPQQIPEEVNRAFRRLCELGYTDQLIR